MFSHMALPAQFRPRPLFCALSVLFAVPAATAGASESNEHVLGAVTVTEQSDYQQPTEATGLYTTRKSASATGLELSLRETPQTLSVVSRTQMDDFRLDSVNEALSASSGVIVEKVETNRTYYTARGFDVTNFQTDGIGIPFAYGNVAGDIDTALYDRIDVVYGANGLMSPTGFPSATINFVRKRPTVGFAAAAGLTVGSWDTYRVQADVSNALVESGAIRGRLVAAREAADSYLDRHSYDKNVFYGVVEAELGSSTGLALGYTQQRNNADSPLWGALPLLHSDGSRTHFDRSTSTAADWSFWDSSIKSAFAELTHRFDSGWQAKAALTRNELRNDGALFYAYGKPDRATGLGLFAYPSLYEMENQQAQADVQVSGQIALGGRRHDVSFGANWSKSALDDVSHYGRGIGTALPPLQTWNGDYPMPAFDAAVNGSSFTHRQRSTYLATRINPADRVKLLAGARATRAETEGVSYGVSRTSDADDVTPYAGVILDLTRSLSLYGSYTEIFNPQHQMDANGNVLDPVEGESREVGLKGEFFDKKLNASVALFRTEQDNLAEIAGYGPGFKAFYAGTDIKARGLQIDVAGQITPRLQGSLGYTQLRMRDDAGEDARTYIPRRLLRVSAVYALPFIDNLKVGASVRWQDDTHVKSGSNEIRQSAYALVDLMARYDISKQLSVAAKLNNVTDEKYIASLYWGGNSGQGFYGAPRNASVSFNWKY